MASYKRTAWRGKPLDSKRVKERGSRTGSKFDSIFVAGVNTYRLQQGSNTFRLLRDEDAEYWAETIWVHSYIGSKSSTYLCPKMMGKSKTCPVCDAAEDAARQGDKDEKYALEAKERAIAWVIDRENEKDGLKVFDMSWSMDRDIAAACEIKKTGKILDITDPTDGYDVSVSRSGNKKNTKYFGLQVDREPSPLSDDQKQADAWLSEVQKRPLLSLLKYRDNEYLAGILTGKIEERDEDQDDADADTQKDDDRDRGRGSRERDEDDGDRDDRRRGRDRDDDDGDRQDRRARDSDDDTRRSRRGDDDDRDRGRGEPRRGRGDDDDGEERGSRSGRTRNRDDDDDDRRGRRGRGGDDDESDQQEDEAEEQDGEAEADGAEEEEQDADDRGGRRRGRDDDDDRDRERSTTKRVRSTRDDDDGEDRGRRGRDRDRDDDDRSRGSKTRERVRTPSRDDDDGEEQTKRRRR